MNTRYCPHCGKASQYATVKPTVCSSCNKPFAAAYANLTPAPVRQAPSVQIGRPRIYRDAKGNDISHLYQHSEPQQDYVDTEDEDYYDENEMRREARELAASVGDSFARAIVANIATSDNTTVKMGDILRAQGITPESLAKQNVVATKGGKKRAKK